MDVQNVDLVSYRNLNVDCGPTTFFDEGKWEGATLGSLVADLIDCKVELYDKDLTVAVVKVQGRYISLDDKMLWCLKEYQRTTKTPVSARLEVKAAAIDADDGCVAGSTSFSAGKGPRPPSPRPLRGNFEAVKGAGKKGPIGFPGPPPPLRARAVSRPGWDKPPEQPWMMGLAGNGIQHLQGPAPEEWEPLEPQVTKAVSNLPLGILARSQTKAGRMPVAGPYDPEEAPA